jgi:hypothetical protein
MEQLQEQLLVGDPEEMRRQATVTLGKILTQRLDPRYRRTAMDVLHYLDQQECAVSSAGWDAYRTAAAQIAALDAIETHQKNPRRSLLCRSIQRELKRSDVDRESASGPSIPVTLETAEDAERRETEIRKLVAERQRMHFGSEAQSHAMRPRHDDPPQAAEEPQVTVTEGVRLERRPGSFGRTIWLRQPNTK